jgi:hypothetical protein
MRAVGMAGLLAAGLAGLTAMGGVAVDAAPAPDAAKAAALQAGMQKLLPTPRLFKVTMTGSLRPPGPGLEECMGGADLAKRVGEIASRPRPAGAPPPGAGCTHSRVTRPDGSFHSEIRCDVAAGAARTYRTTTDGSIKDIRSHTENVITDPQTGVSRTQTRDSRMQDVGPCPANMKSGEVRTADGRIMDPAAELARLRAGGMPARLGAGGRPPLPVSPY